MNDHKFDGPLAAAMHPSKEAETTPLTVFLDIAAPLSGEQQQVLRQWGIDAENGATTLTASVPRAVITELTAQEWIISISLSPISRPLPAARMP